VKGGEYMETQGIIDLINTIDWRAVALIGIGWLLYRKKEE